MSSGGLADEVSVVPGKPAFRTPPLPDLQASKALIEYLSSIPLPDESTLPAVVSKELRLTIVDSIGLALDNNLGIKASYLGRVSEQIALATEEDKFNPVVSLLGNVKTEGGETSTTTISRTIDGAPQTVRFDDFRTRDDSVTWHTSIGPAVTWLLPTGANVQLDLQLEADDTTEKDTGTAGSDMGGYSYGGSTGFSISQPLLKGAGLDINKASIRVAHLNDMMDVLSLRNTIENTISRTILEYRAIIQAKAEVKIAEEALISARRNLANNKAEIEQGRLPKAGLVQYQTQIRQHQISLKQAATALENSRRNLAKTLGQPLDSILDTKEFTPEIIEAKISFKQALPIALANRSDYKAALLAKKSAEITLFLAKNNLLWDVALVAGVHANIGDTRSHSETVGSHFTRSTTRDEQTGWNVGLNFIIPLDDNDQANRVVAVAQTSLLQAEVALKNTRENVVLEIRNVITDMNSNWNQMELSEQAFQLAKQQSEIAQEELKYGRTTNFEVISLDNIFQESKVQKLNTEINYLNTLTALDLALGTTLKTWNIDIGEPEG
jgi:outer membrane protein TolC